MILIMMCLSSCSIFSPKEEDIPSNIIAREKMVVILADMQISEAYLDDLKKTGVRINDSSLLYFQRVFKKNQVSPLAFESSLLYYKSNLAEMDLIYTEVVTRLNELKAKNDEILIQMKADSLRLDSIKEVEIFLDSLLMISDSTRSTDSLAIDSIIIYHFGNK